MEYQTWFNMTFWNNLIGLWDYHLFSPFCWSFHISYYIIILSYYFNFVENHSIVVISYDKVGCQYLKIDNNLGEGEREGVNWAQGKQQIKVTLSCHLDLRLSLINLHSSFCVRSGMRRKRRRRTGNHLIKVRNWPRQDERLHSCAGGLFAWEVLGIMAGLTPGEGFWICFLFSQIFSEPEIGG